jgi:hypothetical protein
MQVRLLGPVDVVVEGGPRPVHGLRRMAVLATLALHCGEVVSTGTPPPSSNISPGQRQTVCCARRRHWNRRTLRDIRWPGSRPGTWDASAACHDAPDPEGARYSWG